MQHAEVAAPAESAGRNERRVFAGCAAVVGVHCIVQSATVSATADDLAHKPLWLLAIAMPPAVLCFSRSHRAVRTVLAVSLGTLAMALGISTSAAHVALAGAEVADVTGIAATVVGLILIGLGFRLALRGRRRAVKLSAGAVLFLALMQWGVIPAINAGVASNARHPAVPSAAGLRLPGARDVSFASADGTRLSGWYVPGRTGVTVIVLHGAHGTRADTLGHLRMLSAAGYGVLAYDARGHGASGGRANALGWQGVGDVSAAVRFLRRQPGVDRERVVALGLSMGAEVALRAAASGVPLSAVVADGAGASTQGDDELVGHGLGPLYASVSWLTMREVELASGAHEPAPLKRVVGGIHVPVLLIASDDRDEHLIDAAYARRIGSNATVWYIPTARHTEGLRAVPRAYGARVIAFVQSALNKHVPAHPARG